MEYISSRKHVCGSKHSGSVSQAFTSARRRTNFESLWKLRLVCFESPCEMPSCGEKVVHRRVLVSFFFFSFVPAVLISVLSSEKLKVTRVRGSAHVARVLPSNDKKEENAIKRSYLFQTKESFLRI